MLSFLHNVKVNKYLYSSILLFFLTTTFTACTSSRQEALPTQMPAATIPVVLVTTSTPTPTVIPPTFTPEATSPPTIAADTNNVTLTPIVNPSPSPTPQIYVVQENDTLIAISLRFDVDYADLLQINKIQDPNLIALGQEIIIPPPSYYEEPSNIVHYRVLEGESFTSIAIKFGIPLDVLQNANANIDPNQIPTGKEIQIPWNGVHIVASGDTLLGIALRYDVPYDALVEANKHVLDFENLNHIEVGWALIIPSENVGETVAEEYDCSPQPQLRTVVMTYTVQAGEDLFCLTSKFNLSASTIVYVNSRVLEENRIEAGMELLIPPDNGVLYTVTADDIDNDVNLGDIVQWYSVREFNSIVDWQGNPVPVPLAAGQQLFLPGADTLAPVFQSVALVTPTSEPAAQPGNSPPPVSNNPSPSTGDTSAALPPTSNPSNSTSKMWTDRYATDSPGYCPMLAGYGWTGSLIWPIDSRSVPDNRDYRPGHWAIDIEADEGVPIYAAQAGTVIWSGYSIFGGGIIVAIAHGGGWRTVYAHLSQSLVRCGQEVAQGAQIGLNGKTGTSSYHLHFAVENGINTYDPLDYLPR